MKENVRDPVSSRTKPVLRIVASPREAWDAILQPWFDRVAPAAWRNTLPSLVVVPTRNHAQGFKARLLENGRSHLGLEFVTPTVLRAMLERDLTDERTPRAHLRLLLAAAAEETMQAAQPSDEQAAKAVVRAPDHLLRTIDRLDMAGWEFERLHLASFQSVVRRFREHLTTCGFDLAGRADRKTLARATGNAPLFANVVLSGFDGAHWPHWFLLRAAVAAAENATVVLEYPPNELGNVDACWIGSWEEALGEAIPVVSPSSKTGDTFFTEEEMRGVGERTPACTFLVGANTSQEAQAIARQSQRFLSDESCTRLGIVFARTGSLPRLVANALAQLDIPHNDGIAHSVPGLFESAEWRAWLELQRGPRINSLLRFMNALTDRASAFPDVSVQKFERVLRAAYSDVLIDDLEILRHYLTQNAGETKPVVAETLASLHVLPARATLANFLHETAAAFTKLGWKQHWMEIAPRVRDWSERFGVEFSRTLYLRWLNEVASSFTAARMAAGDHPYARVQLLTVPQAHGQEWSHLIFAGWNEGSWPPPEMGEFARDDEIAAFNQGIQSLNRRAARQGRQGEGHLAVTANHSLYLGPFEQRQIALRQFETLLASATEGVALSASLVQESAPDRLWNPNELFTRLYRETQRAPLTASTLKSLQRATQDWLQNNNSPASKKVDVSQTRRAYDERRDANKPSGEYDFALCTPSERIPMLSVSEVEALVKAPAIVWLKRYLGVEAPDDDTNLWSSSTGQWVHRWLASVAAGTGFTRLPAAPEIDQRIRAAADEKRAQVTRLCRAAGKALPDWWNSGWQNAFCLARNLGAKLGTIEDWPWLATEWDINGDDPIKVADGATMRFRGRIDLILATNKTSSLASETLWILDYKTGTSTKALARPKAETEKAKSPFHKKLLTGTGMQLGLYAMAARQLGAQEVLLSLVAPAIKPITPQLSLADFEGEAEIFRELARMQQSGVFGMYGQLRSAWSFTRAYPLATLAIDTDLLEDRWELTHPDLAKEEEDFYF